MTDRTLYLDFDGVLHPNFVLKGEIFRRMSQLDDAAMEYPPDSPNLTLCDGSKGMQAR